MCPLKRPEGARAISGDQRRAKRDHPPLGSNAPLSRRRQRGEMHRLCSRSRRSVHSRQRSWAADGRRTGLVATHRHRHGHSSHRSASSQISNPGPAGIGRSNRFQRSEPCPDDFPLGARGWGLKFCDGAHCVEALVQGITWRRVTTPIRPEAKPGRFISDRRTAADSRPPGRVNDNLPLRGS